MPRTVETVSVVRSLSSAVSGLACVVLLSATALAADKVTFLTSWFAQAEHGGFYQAKATGTLRKGRARRHPQDGRPAGQRHAASARRRDRRDDGLRFPGAQGARARLSRRCTIGTSFQFDLQGMMAHDHVQSLADLKDKTILVATPGRTTWWPWLKAKYKYTDEQTKPYTFNLQPFFADKNMVQQSYPSSEPFQAKQQGMPVKFFLFAHDGYPPYGTTMVSTRDFVDKNPDVAARFVKRVARGLEELHERSARRPTR